MFWLARYFFLLFWLVSRCCKGWQWKFSFLNSILPPLRPYISPSQPSRAVKPRKNPSVSHTVVTSHVRTFFQFILRIFFFDCHVTSLSFARFLRDFFTVSYYRKRLNILRYCGRILFLLRKLQSIASIYDKFYSHEKNTSDNIVHFKKSVYIWKRDNLGWPISFVNNIFTCTWVM